MKTLKQIKIDALKEALTLSLGSRKKAAEMLGIPSRTLRYWIQLYPELKPFRKIY